MKSMRCNLVGLRRLLPLLACVVVLFPLSALDFQVKASGNYSTESANPFFFDGAFDFSHIEGPLAMSWEISVDSEGTYPEPFLGDFFGPFSLDIRNAGLVYDLGSLSLYLGKMPLKDEVDSPYSLYLSGASPSAMTGGFRYESGPFAFSNRWVGLDRNVESGLYRSHEDSGIYIERGAVLKSYSYSLGKLRLGFQDATVFQGAYFDIDVFANPAPSFFVQYVLSASGRPNSRSGDQNSIMGFFGDYEGEGWSAYAQLLVDDFNLNRFINPSAYQNPDKIAWSLGGRLELPLGTLGFYTAGATKYTFESVGGEFYSYTMHAGSAVISDGQTIAVPLEDQMLGYIHGENNLAFLTTWSAPLAGMDVQTGLELVLSGSKSPSNPWHNGESWSTLGTQLLNDPALEVRTLLGLRVSRCFGRWTLFAQAKAGYIANRLEPDYIAATSDTTQNLEPVFRPTGDSGPVAEISLGGSWSFGL
ncbi:MAG: hypothetical protein CVV53_00370 [Spirochaetae bacterium HGW-Spirochaetae-9]|nr:MAG: hypothetical protein CVV53_00370 [Spirochaetae bacterium HGW-Spirochaetae-9]